MQIGNPHWLHAPPDRHQSILEARTHFVDILVDNLKELQPATDRDSDKERSKREEDINNRRISLEELRTIIRDDGENTNLAELERSRAVIDPMFRSDGVFGHTKRKNDSFPLPPGWITMYKPRTVRAMQAELDRNKGTTKEGKPGAYCDPCYVGPQYASWSKIDPKTGLYSAVQQKTPIFAWLVYLMYQNSGSTHDPGELARRAKATQLQKERAEAVRALRAERKTKLEQKRYKEREEGEEEMEALMGALADEEDTKPLERYQNARNDDKAADREESGDALADAVTEENRDGDAEDEPADVEIPGDEAKEEREFLKFLDSLD